MLDLPTIKTDFLFENSQDFNQTTHARPQHPIVFIDIISLYFNSIYRTGKEGGTFLTLHCYWGSIHIWWEFLIDHKDL